MIHLGRAKDIIETYHKLEKFLDIHTKRNTVYLNSQGHFIYFNTIKFRFNHLYYSAGGNFLGSYTVTLGITSIGEQHDKIRICVVDKSN